MIRLDVAPKAKGGLEPKAESAVPGQPPHDHRQLPKSLLVSLSPPRSSGERSMEPAVPIEEQLNLDFELGTGHKRAGYPSNPRILGSSGALENADRY